MVKAPDKKRKKRERRKEAIALPTAPWEKGKELESILSEPLEIKKVISKPITTAQKVSSLPVKKDDAERFPFRIFSSMLFTAWLIFFVDQITKIAAQLFLLPRGQVSFGFIALQYTTNTGAAFGIFANTTSILTILSFVAVQLLLFLLLIAYFFPKAPLAKPVTQFLAQPGHTALYTLLLGGAAGNLFDRLFRGYVIDFIEVPFFATFNVADSALSVAIGFLALESGYQWWMEHKNKQRKTP